jgi:hypothetical protein
MKDADIEAFRTFLGEQFVDEDLSLRVLKNRAALYGMGDNIAETGAIVRMLGAIDSAGGGSIDFLMHGARESVIAVIDGQHAPQALAAVHAACIAE